MSRRIAINLTAGGDTFEIPFDQVAALMYVLPPGATEPSINECTIEDNTVIYNVLQEETEGIIPLWSAFGCEKAVADRRKNFVIRLDKRLTDYENND